MEEQQFEKRVEWLDSERRKADQTIAQMERRISLLEEALAGNQELVNSFKRESSRINNATERIADFSKEIRVNKNEIENSVSKIEGRSKQDQKNFELRITSDQQNTTKSIDALRKDMSQIGELRAEMSARELEEVQLGDRIGEIAQDLDNLNKSEEQRQKFARSLSRTGKILS